MSTPSFVHSKHPILVRTKSDKLLLSDFAIPLVPRFHQQPILFNGHLQTIYTVAKFSDPFPVHYARKRFANPTDGGHFTVDFVVAPSAAGEPSPDLPPRTRHMTDDESAAVDTGDPSDSSPMVICLHGLSGGSYELYIRATIAQLLASDAPGGAFAACVVNARGCALSGLSSPQLFNAKFTDDMRLVVAHLRRAFPRRPLFAVGFSLGANILTNYLGEEGAQCPLKAAAVVSNPWNLELTDKSLHRTYLGHHLYSRTLGGNLRRLYELHRDELLKDPRIDPEAAGNIVHAIDFDRTVTAKVFGYQTPAQYYRAASCVDKLLDVRIPLLALHSKDDPIVPDEAAPYEEVQANPYVIMAVTRGGGHIGWFESGGRRWYATTVARWFAKVATEMEGVEEQEAQEQKEEATENGPH